MFDVVVHNLPFLLEGLFVTLKVAFISMIFSMGFGSVLGIVRFVKLPVLSQLSGAFIDLTRSIPLILYIILVHFTFAPALYQDSRFSRFIGVDSLEMFSAVIAIVAFSSAYVAEIIRSGLASIEKDQILAAKALGLNRWQILEFIVYPQALTRMKPALCAQFITLIKDTSLASAIGLIELSRASEIVYETSLHEFQVLAFVALVYVSINFLVQKLFYPEQGLLGA